MKRFRIIFIQISLLLASAQTVWAVDEIIVERPAVVEKWYAALGIAQARFFDEILAEDATIELRDLGITQTRQEFLDSVDELAAATKNAIIVYHYEDIQDDNATVLVCYRFESNEKLVSEHFTFSADKIKTSVQEPRGYDCGDL